MHVEVRLPQDFSKHDVEKGLFKHMGRSIICFFYVWRYNFKNKMLHPWLIYNEDELISGEDLKAALGPLALQWIYDKKTWFRSPSSK